jgi:oligopeptide transport system permease protein
MAAFILRRILIAIPILFAVASLTFLLMRMAPGSPFAAGHDRKLDPKVEARLLERFQLNGTVTQQYFRYLGNLAKGDLGDSTQFRNRSVGEILKQTFPRSMILGGVSLLLSLFIGITLGSIAAVHHNSPIDRTAMLTALAGICLPSFVIAPIFVLIFSIIVPIFPVAGWGTPAQLILPALCLALPFGAYTARLMRTSMLEVLQQDFVRTARAKGLSEQVVIAKHALKTAILPVVSFTGPLAANILTGSLVVEEIFKIPGMGSFFVTGVMNRDVFLVGGSVLVYAALLLFFNLIADVLYALLDRRIRLW